MTPNSWRTTEDTEMWPDLLNPVWPSLPHSLTWPHSFYSSQHSLMESTRGKQRGEKESVCLNVLFQSFSLTKQQNSTVISKLLQHYTSHLATAIGSSLGTYSRGFLSHHSSASSTLEQTEYIPEEEFRDIAENFLILWIRVFGNLIHHSDRHCYPA